MAFPKPDFAPGVISAAQQHARESWPNESCGLIVGDAYMPCVNRAGNPLEHFRIDPDNLLSAGDNLRAVIHSHPDGERAPSAADMRGQIDTGCIWGIIPCTELDMFAPVWWGDFRLDEPLVGRDFIHGVTDCGTIIRSWYWQEKQILLPEFPRDDNWWKDGQDIYQAVYAKAGFKRINPSEARTGDVFLGMVRSKVPNHGGVLVSDKGLALHHLENRLSRHEPILPWMKYVTHWLRYDGAPDAGG